MAFNLNTLNTKVTIVYDDSLKERMLASPVMPKFRLVSSSAFLKELVDMRLNDFKDAMGSHYVFIKPDKKDPQIIYRKHVCAGSAATTRPLYDARYTSETCLLNTYLTVYKASIDDMGYYNNSIDWPTKYLFEIAHKTVGKKFDHKFLRDNILSLLSSKEPAMRLLVESYLVKTEHIWHLHTPPIPIESLTMDTIQLVSALTTFKRALMTYDQYIPVVHINGYTSNDIATSVCEIEVF